MLCVEHCPNAHPLVYKLVVMPLWMSFLWDMSLCVGRISQYRLIQLLFIYTGNDIDLFI